MTKDQVLQRLRRSGGDYVSGGTLSAELSLSRTAVWKAVEQLRADGFVIESAPNKGYRLLAAGDALTESGVRLYLRHKELNVKVYKSISSTNTVLKQLAESGDITKNIGIRMVFRIARDVQYQNILGLNVLTIRI